MCVKISCSDSFLLVCVVYVDLAFRIQRTVNIIQSVLQSIIPYNYLLHIILTAFSVFNFSLNVISQECGTTPAITTFTFAHDVSRH